MTHPTDRDVSQFVLDAGEASQANVKWGKSGYRNVVIFNVKNINIRALVALISDY